MEEMTDREILSNAIDKAIANGWSAGKVITTNPELLDEAIDMGGFASIIFSHSFVKAFWGEEQVIVYVKCDEVLYEDNEDHSLYMLPAWQHHLQQMVLEENPIKYLEKWL